MTSNPQARRGTLPRAVPAAVEHLERRELFAAVFALQAKNAIVAVDTAAPDAVLATLRVRGLARGETLRGIDFRAADNQLYGLGSTNRLYTINTVSGAATPVGTSTFALNLTGAEYGFDFNPAADRIRVVSEANENFRLVPTDGSLVDADPNTAGVQTDAALAYDAADVNAGQNPAVVGVAYTNNDTEALSLTSLFAIDAERNVLVRQGSPDGTPVSPNTGTLFTVGALGVDAENVGGFDIQTSGPTNTAFAALSTSLRHPSQLYSIDLTTGAASAIGNIGRARKPVLGIAVAPTGRSFFLVNTRNELLGLNTSTPSLVLSRNRITGLSSTREKIVGIDFRPSTGLLWALTDAGRNYVVDTATGAADPFGAASAVPFTARASYGYDFNPSADRIRVVNSAQQNLRFDPNSGNVVDFNPASPALDPDTGVAYVPGDPGAQTTPRIVGSAYTNNVAGGTPTTLYAVDSARDALATQGSAGGTLTSPNTGQLFTVGPTNVNVPDQMGFDIVTIAGVDTAFAVFAPGGRGTTNLYQVNLVSGQMDLVTALGRQVKGVTAFAVQTGA